MCNICAPSPLQIGVMEALVGSSLVGIVYALFSGQPLSIMGITGPTALFEGLVYFVTRCSNRSSIHRFHHQ